MDPAAPKQQNLLIVPCLGGTPGHEERRCYQIYVVPLSELGTTDCPAELRPKFLVDCSEFGREICLVGSRIYLFDSDSKPDLAVGFFQLSSFLDSDVVLKSTADMVSHMAPMRHPKRSLKVVPTPGGKILAFSTKMESKPFNPWDMNSSNVVVDFELYDPQTDSWEELPPLPGRFDSNFADSRYTFLDDTAFAMEDDARRQYCLILGAHGTSSYWLHHFYSGGTIPTCGYTRAVGVGGDQLWLTPYGVWDIKGGDCKLVCRFPFRFDPAAVRPDPDDDSYSPRSQSIVVFEETSSCCFKLETSKHGLSGDLFLKTDVYKLELLEYFKGVEEATCCCGLCAPQLEGRLLSSTMFCFSSAGCRLRLVDRTPIIIQPAAHGVA